MFDVKGPSTRPFWRLRGIYCLEVEENLFSLSLVDCFRNSLGVIPYQADYEWNHDIKKNSYG